MSNKRGMTCQITSFLVDNPPQDGVMGPHPWMAIATAQVFDPNVQVKGLTEAGVILSGEAMRIINGRASATTEAVALMAALRALLFQLHEGGFSDGGNELTARISSSAK